MLVMRLLKQSERENYDTLILNITNDILIIPIRDIKEINFRPFMFDDGVFEIVQNMSRYDVLTNDFQEKNNKYIISYDSVNAIYFED